jgi:hypothetical protein
MKREKIILSAAALIVTVIGAFSFKTAGKFNPRHQLLGSFRTNAGTGKTVCVKVTCWTKMTGSSGSGRCHTTVNQLQTVRKTYLTRTPAGECTIVYSLAGTRTGK